MSGRRTVALVAVLNLVAGAAFGFAASRFVGPGVRGPGGPGRPGTMLAEALDLDPERAKKVDEILERHRPEFEAARRESDARLAAIRDRADEEMRVVLTPEQFVKLLELRRELERGVHGPR